MNRRRRRHRNKKDIYGIYEIPDYQGKRKKKKKKEFTLKSFCEGLVACVVLLILFYGVSFGVKYSMRSKGIDLYNRDDYEGAVDLFEEALKPQLPFFEFFDTDVRLYLADCYVNLGQYGYACSEYEKIRVWTNGRLPKGVSQRMKIAYGLQLYDWQEYRSALPILLEAYESGYGDLVLYVGSCYGQIGDLENMQLYYDVFLQKNDMNSFMYAQYAAIALDRDSLEEAVKYMDIGRSLEDQSNIKEILFDEIVYYEKVKDYNKAFEKAKEFLELYPNDTDGKAEYDLLYTRQTVVEE